MTASVGAVVTIGALGWLVRRLYRWWSERKYLNGYRVGLKDGIRTGTAEVLRALPFDVNAPGIGGPRREPE